MVAEYLGFLYKSFSNIFTDPSAVIIHTNQNSIAFAEFYKFVGVDNCSRISILIKSSLLNFYLSVLFIVSEVAVSSMELIFISVQFDSSSLEEYVC
jgi:hypothetical protein